MVHQVNSAVLDIQWCLKMYKPLRIESLCWNADPNTAFQNHVPSMKHGGSSIKFGPALLPLDQDCLPSLMEL